MPIAGTLTLLSATIAAAVSAVTPGGNFGTVPSSLLVQFDFTYAAGGTNLKAWLQTSVDGGTTWCDIANFAAATTSIRRLYNLTGAAVTAIATPTDGTLADNTSVNGLLGSLYRVKLTTTGTYTGATTLVVTAVPA